MKIEETYICNKYNITLVADYMGVAPDVLLGFYEELRADTAFIADLNARMAYIRSEYGFDKGIFRMESVPSVDWFAFERVLLYILVRLKRPKFILETGVFYGGNTVFLLKGLQDNGEGRLISVDLPDSHIRRDKKQERHPGVGDSEFYREDLRSGFLVPPALEANWELAIGDSLSEIPSRREIFDMYVHDSDHSYAFLKSEMAAALPKLAADGVAVVDDIDWSNAFYEACVVRKLHPLLLTDNGKDNLRVRIGMLRLDHPFNGTPAVTG